MLRRIFALLLTFLMLFVITSCGSNDKTANHTISVDLDTAPKNIDPQLANSSSEIIVATNCFEGLFRYDKDGKIALGVASSYIVSANKKSYKFTLKKNLVWQDSTPLTAYDFVFAFQRALRKETRSPNAADLFSIVNAKALYNGSVSASSLGIKAQDNITLTINLAYADLDFTETLTKPIAMPCNESFFNSCKGRYGLERKYILTNGAFYLKLWDNDTHKIRLNRNKKYKGTSLVKPSAILLSFNGDKTQRSNKISTGIYDCGLVSSDMLDTVKESTVQTHYFYNETFAIYINPPQIEDDNIRKALVMAIDKDSISLNLPSQYVFADGIIPNGITVRGKGYRTTVGTAQDTPYNPTEAKRIYTTKLKEMKVKTLSLPTLYYPDEPNMKLIANLVAQNWQKNLGAYVNTAPVTRSELLSSLRSGICKMALLPLTSTDGSAKGFLEQFTSSSVDNILGIKNASLDRQIESITGNLSDKNYLNTLLNSEKMLLKENYILPLFFTPSCFITAKNISGIRFTKGGDYIDFIGTLVNS